MALRKNVLESWSVNSETVLLTTRPSTTYLANLQMARDPHGGAGVEAERLHLGDLDGG